MEIVRLKGFFGTTLLILGAFLVGGTLHGALIEGAYSLTTPATVLPTILGLVFIVVGHRLYIPATEYVETPSSSETGTSDHSGDIGLSPLEEEDFEDLERDDSYDQNN